jgi:hypothetical protein
VNAKTLHASLPTHPVGASPFAAKLHAGRHAPLFLLGGLVVGTQTPGEPGASGPSQKCTLPSQGVVPPQGSHDDCATHTGLGNNSPPLKGASLEHTFPIRPSIPPHCESEVQAVPVVPHVGQPPLLLLLPPLLLPPLLLPPPLLPPLPLPLEPLELPLAELPFELPLVELLPVLPLLVPPLLVLPPLLLPPFALPLLLELLLLPSLFPLELLLTPLDEEPSPPELLLLLLVLLPDPSPVPSLPASEPDSPFAHAPANASAIEPIAVTAVPNRSFTMSVILPLHARRTVAPKSRQRRPTTSHSECASSPVSGR